MLPHRYPFQLVEPATPGRLFLRLTADAALCRPGSLAAPLALEVLAQAAALAPPSDDASTPTGGGGEPPLLAGLDAVTFADSLAHRPLAPGDTLEARLERLAGLGRIQKLRGVLLRDGEPVVEAELVLAGV